MSDSLVPPTKLCKNCSTAFNDAYSFCPHCGQQSKDDLTVGVLFYNTISNYFSFDARFLKSVLPLIFRPGHIAKAFVSGKRLQYLHPAQYYLFISVLFFFLFSFQVREINAVVDAQIKKGYEFGSSTPSREQAPGDEANNTDQESLMPHPELQEERSNGSTTEKEETDSIVQLETSQISGDFGYNIHELDSLIAIQAPEQLQLQALGMDEASGLVEQIFLKQYLKFHKQRGGGIVQAFFDTIPIALFFLLPIFALVLKLIFSKRIPYTHHLVFSFYYFSFLFIVLTLLTALNLMGEIPDWVNQLFWLFSILYLWGAIHNFYQYSWKRSFFRSLLVLSINLLFIIPLSFVLVLITSFVFY